MFVYSGECREGKCGEPTPLIDVNEQKLFVGDIVIISVIDEFGICSNNGLTVVVSDKYTSYSGGSYVEKENGINYFIMGIKDVDFMSRDPEWIVLRVKSFQDVIDGEFWRDYGFNYSID